MRRVVHGAVSSQRVASRDVVQRAPTPQQRLGNRSVERLVRARVAQAAIQRTPRGRDTTAQAIIDAAKDEHAEPSAEKRAINAVWAIARTYYGGQVAKIKDVAFKGDEHGLLTTSQGRGASTTGVIEVGSYFLEHIDDFAHRVLQVGHELQHVDQYRANMTGRPRSAEREFLAYYWEGLQGEATGTGHMSAATRRTIIDAALGYLLCLSSDEQAAYANKRDELLAKRRTVDGVRGNAPVPEPTGCRHVE